MSRNVKNMYLDFWKPFSYHKYKFPDFFYFNSSVKQLILRFNFSDIMISGCCVSWTSLKKLCLLSCSLFDESMAKILSGCPLLESLTLCVCVKLSVLDLSKSLRLRILKLDCNLWAEAKLDLFFVSTIPTFQDDFLQLQVMALTMLEKLQNVDKLTLKENFLHILSLAEVRGVPFPMLKVKYLTLETVIFRYVIPGIERVLQNSPDLKQLTVHAKNCNNAIREEDLDNYLEQEGLNPDQCWRSKDGVDWNTSRLDVESKHMVSFMELVLKNTKTLDKMILLWFKFKDLEVPALSHNNNVSIVVR
ncbi:unnamed protein product [Arabidopsis halleri]